MKNSFITLLLVVIIGVATFGQTFFNLDPGFRWQVIETPHFRIIFHQGEEGLAQEAALIAEDAWEYWLRELDYAPEGKTDIVLADTADYAIGGAASMPNKTILIGTSNVRTYNEWLNSREQSWLEEVIYHEYGHIVDIGKVSGISKALRSIFGNIVMPNSSKPGFFIEGVVISAEYRRAGESRANDPRDAMYLREMLIQDSFPSLAQASQYTYERDRWPSAYMVGHDYGGWLVRYIGEEYGPEAIKRIDELNAKSLLPNISLGFINDFEGVMKRTLGVSAKQFFSEFKEWLNEQFATQIEQTKSEGVIDSRKIGRLKYWNNRPAWSPDGEWIAYYHYDPSRAPGIRIIRPDGTKDHQLISANPGLDFFRPHFWAPIPSWSPDGSKLVYAKLEIYNHFYIYGDIYLYDLKAGREERLTYGERAYNPIFFPGGDRVLFAKQGMGGKSPDLAVLDLATNEISILKKFPDDFLIDSLAISSDGEKIALSAWRRGGFQDIYLMPAEGGELTPLTQDRATDLNPAWSPNSEYILFSSDRDGVNNLYAYSLEDEALFKVTNVLSGAFAPDVSPDGIQIAFVDYSIDGYEVHTMEYNPEDWQQVPYQKEEVPKWEGYPQTDYPIHPYNPRPSLSPKLLLPFIIPDSAGYLTFGMDALFQQFYTFVAGYSWKEGAPFYLFNYSNEQLRPTFTVDLSQFGSVNQQSLEISLPLASKLGSSQNVSFRYHREDSEVVRNGLTFSWKLASSWGMDLLKDTRVISAAIEIGKVSGSSELQKQLKFDWREKIHLPFESRQELAMKLSYGWSNVAENLSLGGDSGHFLLRGYKRGAFKGEQVIAGSLEYRFPILTIEQGLGLWPLFLDDLRGSIFLDGGAAGEKIELSELEKGFGGELLLSTGLGYSFIVDLRLGIAQGWGERKPLVYFGLDTAF